MSPYPFAPRDHQPLHPPPLFCRVPFPSLSLVSWHSLSTNKYKQWLRRCSYSSSSCCPKRCLGRTMNRPGGWKIIPEKRTIVMSGGAIRMTRPNHAKPHPTKRKVINHSNRHSNSTYFPSRLWWMQQQQYNHLTVLMFRKRAAPQ